MTLSPMNKNVDIKFSAYDSFLESSSTGTFKVERLDIQIMQRFVGAIKTKGHTKNRSTSIKSNMGRRKL
jgi:hypothetical protein